MYSPLTSFGVIAGVCVALLASASRLYPGLVR